MHISFITSSYFSGYPKNRWQVGKSLYIATVTIVAGLLLIPGAIRAQSGRDLTSTAIMERMSACEGSEIVKQHSFNVKLGRQISSLIEGIKSRITGDGGRFEGDARCGCFFGNSILGVIKGEYRSISDTEVEITIEDKPFIIPYRTIESRIREYLS
jgi:hypothetical protein